MKNIIVPIKLLIKNPSSAKKGNCGRFSLIWWLRAGGCFIERTAGVLAYMIEQCKGYNLRNILRVGINDTSNLSITCGRLTQGL